LKTGLSRPAGRFPVRRPSPGAGCYAAARRAAISGASSGGLRSVGMLNTGRVAAAEGALLEDPYGGAKFGAADTVAGRVVLCVAFCAARWAETRGWNRAPSRRWGRGWRRRRVHPMSDPMDRSVPGLRQLPAVPGCSRVRSTGPGIPDGVPNEVGVGSGPVRVGRAVCRRVEVELRAVAAMLGD
jgi:hypothetical protein